VALTTLIRFVNKTKSMGSFIESLKSLFSKRSHLKCHLCGKTMTSTFDFDEHMKTIHK